MQQRGQRQHECERDGARHRRSRSRRVRRRSSSRRGDEAPRKRRLPDKKEKADGCVNGDVAEERGGGRTERMLARMRRYIGDQHATAATVASSASIATPIQPAACRRRQETAAIRGPPPSKHEHDSRAERQHAVRIRHHRRCRAAIEIEGTEQQRGEQQRRRQVYRSAPATRRVQHFRVRRHADPAADRHRAVVRLG